VAKAKDPTEPIRLAASRFPGVDKGTACTQSSFKAGKQAFLYIGEQGGRCKAMFKLDASKAEAARLAKSAPDDFQVGSTAWVTARFSADEPMPTRLWKRWLEESYELSVVGATKKKVSTKKIARKKTTGKKTSKKKVARKR
jgi:predicted DNA-binding protein (MmcQ/YjbR family)